MYIYNKEKGGRLAIIVFVMTALVTLAYGCKTNNTTNDSEMLVKQTPVGPDFNADSAYNFCKTQCDFGPRTMNSKAHEDCREWIIGKFKQYGCTVTEQQADITAWDGKTLKCTNIIASYKPEKTTRVLLCAHWDSRPWADNDPDSANWKTPVMAANDGASGVAVLLEIARIVNKADSLDMGVDFICFDAEDYGVPQWSDVTDMGDSWALGAQYWSKNPHRKDYEAAYGILLDMVGGQGAQFYQEGMSLTFAPMIVKKIHAAAKVVGYGSYFPDKVGGSITDDHIPINQNRNIPTADIIAYYPDCEQSSFGPTWHTINDTMEHIDRNTLKAVGQTVVQVLFSN
ncbi:MAG: M28 family peptidase [Prevotella sp.]|uniref:M28 family peptidase n=1 Tax=Prevotella sp. TaxID=59823 RepID=UPI002A269C15|nr:M28 family peptidase [Prevotella sp.]MDD7318401.1 M28 family peptidase [Prevotellaceae bacterium]MDY4020248.1 M28 family peptidase [Prevotella sp.]